MRNEINENKALSQTCVMVSADYKGYRIEPNKTGYVNYDFYKPDDELISGNGQTIEDCKKQIDEIIYLNE